MEKVYYYSEDDDCRSKITMLVDRKFIIVNGQIYSFEWKNCNPGGCILCKFTCNNFNLKSPGYIVYKGVTERVTAFNFCILIKKLYNGEVSTRDLYLKKSIPKIDEGLFINKLLIRNIKI